MSIQAIKEMLNDNKSGKKLNKEQQQVYMEEMSIALSECEHVSDLYEYIVSGAAVGGVKAYVNWCVLQSNEIQLKETKELLRCKEFSSLKSALQYRMLLLILSSYISSAQTENPVIPLVLHWIPRSVAKKDNTRINEFTSYTKLYFVDAIPFDSLLPDLKSFDLSEVFLKQIVSIFSEAIFSIDFSKKTDKRAEQKYKEWINKYTESLPESGKNDTVPLDGKKSNDELSSTEQQLKSTRNNKISKKLVEIADEIEEIELSLKEQKKLIVEKEVLIGKLQSQLEISQTSYLAANEAINEKDREISELASELEKIKEENKSLLDRVSRQSSVIDIYGEDKEKVLVEQRNAIASSLVRMYKNFEEYRQMELSSDLEMSLVDLLEDVFIRLKKNGIDVKGRM